MFDPEALRQREVVEGALRKLYTEPGVKTQDLHAKMGFSVKVLQMDGEGNDSCFFDPWEEEGPGQAAGRPNFTGSPVSRNLSK